MFRLLSSYKLLLHANIIYLVITIQIMVINILNLMKKVDRKLLQILKLS